MIIKNKRIIKVGGSYYINVPKDFIDNGQIAKDKRYDFELKEVA